jgi:hypothetical protein
MGSYSLKGKVGQTKKSASGPRPVEAASPEQERFVTSPMTGRSLVARSTDGLTTSPFSTSALASRRISPDAPTPAVPLSSLLDEAQQDYIWNTQAETKTAREAGEQDLTLYRLAIDAGNLNYEQAFTILALTVEFFHKGEHIERVEQHALRTAAGVILRIHRQLENEPLRILAPFYLNQLRNIFQAWHLYRELAKAIDNRSDFLVRMRGKTDQLILDSLFSEEGRSMLAARVEGFISACSRMQLASEPLRRAEWIGKLLMYRTETDQWQVPPEACLGLCTRLLREIHDEALMGALRNLAAASWEGLCKETNYLRDLFAEASVEDATRGVILIRTPVPTVGIPVNNVESVPYFPEVNAFHDLARKRRDKGDKGDKGGVVRLIV